MYEALYLRCLINCLANQGDPTLIGSECGFTSHCRREPKIRGGHEFHLLLNCLSVAIDRYFS